MGEIYREKKRDKNKSKRETTTITTAADLSQFKSCNEGNKYYIFDQK